MLCCFSAVIPDAVLLAMHFNITWLLFGDMTLPFVNIWDFLGGLSIQESQSKGYTQSVIDTNLSRIVSLITNRLNHATSRTSMVWQSNNIIIFHFCLLVVVIVFLSS